jgi:antagonist of KipI
MSLRVVEPGLCTLVVDSGRPTGRSLGVPVGGPADRSAFVLGNAMLGNPCDAAALEITLAGPVLQALDRTGAVLLGAPFSMSCGRRQLASNKSFTLEPGEELHIGGARRGARGYLCVVGGLQGKLTLGSRSSLAPLKRGEQLQCVASFVRPRAVHKVFEAWQVPVLAAEAPGNVFDLRVVPGPEAEAFGGGGQELWGGSAEALFTVRPESNRMALRLAGKPIVVPQQQMVSQPMAAGAVQVTPDGQTILLGVDGQTIGGYPRIAHVISADFDLVGQLRPGDRVRFRLVSLEQAQRFGLEKRALLKRWCIRWREAAGAIA